MSPVTSEMDFNELYAGFAETRLARAGANEKELRLQALEAFLKTGYPEPADEEWKYTPLDALTATAWTLAAPPPVVDADMVSRYTIQGLDCHRIVLIDGFVQQELSSSDVQGLEWTSAADLLRASAAGVRKVLGPKEGETAPFEHLNRAFFQDGLILHTDANAVIDKPVHILNISSGGRKMAAVRSFMHLGEGSRLCVIETCVSLSPEAAWTNCVNEVSLERRASLERYFLQRENDSSVRLLSEKAALKGESELKAAYFIPSARLTRVEPEVRLVESGASCEVSGLALLDGKQAADNRVVVRHEAAGCRSRQLFKGVVDGRGRYVFSGTIRVEEDAQKTDAEQINKNLLLSDEACADTRPQLEIYADDVKCAHGAAVGELDESQIFYLRSRGLDEDSSRRLLIRGFAGQVLEGVGCPALRSWFDAELLGPLDSGGRPQGE